MARDLRNLPWRLLLLANLLAASASALFWVSLFVSPTSFSQNPTEQYPVAFAVKGNTAVELAALFGLFLLGGNLLYVFYGWRPQAPTQHVRSETQDGPVKISREAIETGLRVAGEGIEEISRLRVAVEPGGKRVVVRAQFQSPEGVDIQAASQQVRRTMQRRFLELVRLADPSRLDVDIEFLGFSGKLAKKTVEPAPVHEEPATFKGPEYPIDDDEDPFEGRGHP